MLTLNVAIITHRPEGIRRLARNELPAIPGVSYVISWQSHENEPLPPQLVREDVRVVRFDGTGQVANRNNVISRCDADIIMLSDDDVTFFADGIRELQRRYEQMPDADFITFRSVRDSGVVYPEGVCRLQRRLPRGYYVGCLELSFRRKTAGWLRCCPELGLGSAKMHGGEDEMLLQTAIRRGLACYFVPVTICVHDHPSTGTKGSLTDENLRAAGCVIALTYGGASALLRVPLKAWRVWRAGRASLRRSLKYIALGAIGARGVRRRNRATLW